MLLQFVGIFSFLIIFIALWTQENMAMVKLIQEKKYLFYFFMSILCDRIGFFPLTFF